MIKVLSLCAALLAPESSGQDPHGRSAHLELDSDFNTSYSACIATLKQARKYKIDPFVSAALMYRTTKFSPKLAKSSTIFRRISENYGCQSNSEQFIKSSCSPFMLFAPSFVTLLEKSKRHVSAPENYRTSLRKFLRNDRKSARIVENMAKRFADVYSRTHSGFVWRSPFQAEEEFDEEADQLFYDLNQRQPYDSHISNLHQQMEREVQILHAIFGNHYRIEASANNNQTPEYLIHVDYQNLKQFLWYIAGNTAGPYKPTSLQEYDGQRFVLQFRTPRMRVILSPMGMNLFGIIIKW